MIGESTLLSLALLYVCLLFLLAWYADYKPALSKKLHPLIYALSLSVYCSSWTFYGAVGSASNSAWSHLPIYLGPILLYLFGWPIIKRLLEIGSHQRVTSIADFIGSRYGKRQGLAALVTLVAAAAVLPYIALQLKALSQAWNIVTNYTGFATAPSGDSALFAAVIMTIFTILFGTRRLDSRERHRGVMAAVAVESLVKLIAFFSVAALATAYLSSRLSHEELVLATEPLFSLDLNPDFFAQLLISMLAIICLPRQFHVTVVEYQGESDTRLARWLFPLYLLAFMVLVIPISVAGKHMFSVSSVNPDTYVQLMPLVLEHKWITTAAYIGGISAATGMVIVATVSLAIMITNELVAPAMIRFTRDSTVGLVRLGDSLRRIRQLSIASIFLLSWLVGRELGDFSALAAIGFLSFLAAAQLGPALLIGIFWRRAHAIGVIAGMLTGAFIWFYCALLPSLLHDGHYLLETGPLGIGWLKPTELFGIQSQYQLAMATFWSLLLNTSIFVALSVMVRPDATDRRQARLFLDAPDDNDDALKLDFSRSPIRVSQLRALLPPFLGDSMSTQLWQEFEALYEQRLLPGDRAPQFVVSRIESLLAANIGAASAHRAVLQLEESQQLEYRDLAGMVTDASRLNEFNRELLQTTVETVSQGISVVDRDLNLVAWNKSYEAVFDFPERFLYIGCPIERVYQFNAERGLLGTLDNNPEEIAKRLTLLRSGSPYRLERVLPNGSVIDIRGNPMPHGGFVTTYTDISEYKDMLGQIEEARDALEQRLEKGSLVLSETNTRLRTENRLRAQAEAKLREAHASKSRFMSATSHDLLQPINAARLFTETLKARHREMPDPALNRIVDSIDSSLAGAEELITALREIARLDSGKQHPQRVNFSAAEFIGNLAREFEMMATIKNLPLISRTSNAWLYSDPHLLRRILQNFLSNAIRYTNSGKVLLACRRHADNARIEVWDTGPGIPDSDHARIFTEFERLQRNGAGGDQGLGLGLAIVKRCAEMLGHPVDLRSKPGHGTMFSITVPLGRAERQDLADQERSARGSLDGLQALCIDNERDILEGMEQLLGAWGCATGVATDGAEAISQWMLQTPSIVLADYHLSADENGLDVMANLNKGRERPVPAIIISADDSAQIRAKVKTAGYKFMAKPVNPGRLRAMIMALVASE